MIGRIIMMCWLRIKEEWEEGDKGNCLSVIKLRWCVGENLDL